MPNLQQIKFERLRAQTERDLIYNEILKGTLVRWDDVKVVFGQRISEARNQIMMLPSMYADRLTREEVEQFRKIVNEALARAASVSVEELKKKKRKYNKQEEF